MKTTTFAVRTYQTCHGSWVFDDARVNLEAEPFVAGADLIVERLATMAGINEPARGFMLVFAAKPFRGYQIRLDWKRADIGRGPLATWKFENPIPGAGNTYECPALGLEGWLCPALYRYFARAPKHIYAAALAIEQTTTRTKKHEIKIQSYQTEV